jgi:5-methylcytosine-specific restriction enzyme subunit McrC
MSIDALAGDAQAGPRVPLANLYYLLCYAHNRLEARDLIDVSTLTGTAPVHLYAVILDEGMRRLRQRGVPRLYRTITEDTRAPRGRIALSATISQGLLVRGQVRCEVDILTEDVAYGRTLKAALRRLAGNREIAYAQRTRLREHVRFLGCITDVWPTPALLADARAMRLDSTSAFVLDICAMVLEDALIRPGEGPARFRSWGGSPQQMGLLFENFVCNFLRREQHRFHVSKPPIRWRVEASSTDRRFLPGMEGDILLSDTTQRILIEAKFTPWPLNGTKLRSGHLYQLHTYLAHLADGISPLTGVLLYAEVDGPLRLDYVLAGHRLLIRSLDLAQPFEGIHKDLLALAQEVAADTSAPGSIFAAGLGERP